MSAVCHKNSTVEVKITAGENNHGRQSHLFVCLFVFYCKPAMAGAVTHIHGIYVETIDHLLAWKTDDLWGRTTDQTKSIYG